MAKSSMKRQIMFMKYQQRFVYSFIDKLIIQRQSRKYIKIFKKMKIKGKKKGWSNQKFNTKMILRYFRVFHRVSENGYKYTLKNVLFLIHYFVKRKKKRFKSLKGLILFLRGIEVFKSINMIFVVAKNLDAKKLIKANIIKETAYYQLNKYNPIESNIYFLNEAMIKFFK